MKVDKEPSINFKQKKKKKQHSMKNAVLYF